MQNILANIPESHHRQKTLTFLGLTVLYLGAFVWMGFSSNADANSILGFDPILLMVIQGFASGIFFLLLPFLLWRYGLQLKRKDTFQKMDLPTIGYTLALSIASIIIISAVGVWNLGLDLPDSAFEIWAKAKEAELKILTEHLIDFTSLSHFLLAIVVIGIIPAVGEELLFRGLIQNFVAKLSNNYHVGIWVSAILFSAIHLQFYGFFPRMLLGVFFGYLYVWSGRLSVAMFAHFLNNTIALVMAYVAGNWMEVEPSVLGEESAPWQLVLLFMVIGGFTLYKFKNHFRNERLAESI